MRFFVTGAAGKLGKAICSKLIEKGYSVTGFDLIQSDLKQELYSHVSGDIKNKSQILASVKNCDCIIHSAVYKGNYNENLREALDINMLGTVNIYECAHELNVSKVILLSSAPVDKQIPIDNPIVWKSDSGNDHLYDLTKRLQEEIARDYFETFKLKTIILRLGHIVNGKANTDLEGNSLTDLKYCLGGWVDIQDVSEAVLFAAQYDKSFFEIFNIIGSELKQDPFDVKQTIFKLGWNPVYRFKEQTNL